MLSIFKAARRVSAPIVVIKTADQYAAVQTIIASFQNGDGLPLLAWDCLRGITALNKAGQLAFSALGVEQITTANPPETLLQALRLPERSILFCYNFHRVIGNEIVSQGVWNVREQFKRDGRTLVLLCPDITLPPEIANDALVIDEALPDRDYLKGVVAELIDTAGYTVEGWPEGWMKRTVDAVAGLAAFPAEQSIAMSLQPEGIDIDGLWERKRQAIEQAPGLSVYRGTETFDDIGGLTNVKTFGCKLLAGNAAPRVILFIDELEKMMGGVSSDTSGTAQEMLGETLTWMQENEKTGSSGILCVGFPGSGKSAFAKALGNTGKIPTIVYNLSGMKASLVGESGRNLRNANKVVDAVAQGRVLVVATCNGIASLPPELRRRFTRGTFFFDLPSDEERVLIWKMYIQKFDLKFAQTKTRPNDSGWTGAEIRTCCELAWALNVTLLEASTYIVPVAKSMSESITKLRVEASGKYISASAPGLYEYDDQAISAPAPGRRTRAFQEA
jgi:hypothetical protein